LDGIEIITALRSYRPGKSSLNYSGNPPMQKYAIELGIRMSLPIVSAVPFDSPWVY